MKRPERKTQVLDMSPESWAALDRLARETNSLATKGSRLGLPSWRAMIRRLATGELVLAQAPDEANRLALAERIQLGSLDGNPPYDVEELRRTSLPSSASQSPEATTQPLKP